MAAHPIRANALLGPLEVAAGGLFGAGLIHLAAILTLPTRTAAELIFLGLAGIAEVGCGVALGFRPGEWTVRLSVVLAGFLATLYVVTRVLPAPFDSLPQSVDSFGAIVLLAEGMSLIGLFALARQATTLGGNGTSVIASYGDHLIFGVTLAWAVYWLATPVGSLLITAQPSPAGAPSEVGGSAAVAALRPAEPLLVLTNGAVDQSMSPSNLAVSADVVAAATLLADPKAPYERTLVVQLHRTEPAATPIDGVSVVAVGRMPGMPGSDFTSTAVATGSGRYQLLLPFSMPGQWQIELRVATPTQRGTVNLAVNVGSDQRGAASR
jgi:hypothetical protein